MFDDAIRPKKETERQPPSAVPVAPPGRRVRCELPERITVLPGEVELIHHLLGELIPILFE